MFKLKTLIAAVITTLSLNVFAAKQESENNLVVVMCDAGKSFARFVPVLDESQTSLGAVLNEAGCIASLRPSASHTLAVTDKGVRIERMSKLTKSLVRVVSADGSAQGYAVYRGYAYSPNELAAVDVVLGLSEAK